VGVQSGMKGFSLRDTLLVMAVCLVFAGVGLIACIWLWHAVDAGRATEAEMRRSFAGRSWMGRRGFPGEWYAMFVILFLAACAATALCVFGAGFTYYLYRKSHRT